MATKQAKGRKIKTNSVVVRDSVTGRFIDQIAITRHTHITQKDNIVRDIKETAARITGNMQIAERWYAKPNDLLGGRTPEQAVQEGDQDQVVGLLLNAAGQ